MPLIYVQRFSQAQAVTGGTQSVSGVFDLTGETEFFLDPTVFTVAGTYTLVSYSTFTYPGAYGSGQAALNALVTVDDSALVGLTASGLTDTGTSITVTLS